MSGRNNSDEFAKLCTRLKRRVVFDKNMPMFRKPLHRRPRDLARQSKKRALARARREHMRAQGPQPLRAWEAIWPTKSVSVSLTLHYVYMMQKLVSVTLLTVHVLHSICISACLSAQATNSKRKRKLHRKSEAALCKRHPIVLNPEVLLWLFQKFNSNRTHTLASIFCSN